MRSIFTFTLAVCVLASSIPTEANENVVRVDDSDRVDVVSWIESPEFDRQTTKVLRTENLSIDRTTSRIVVEGLSSVGYGWKVEVDATTSTDGTRETSTVVALVYRRADGSSDFYVRDAIVHD